MVVELRNAGPGYWQVVLAVCHPLQGEPCLDNMVFLRERPQEAQPQNYDQQYFDITEKPLINVDPITDAEFKDFLELLELRTAERAAAPPKRTEENSNFLI